MSYRIEKTDVGADIVIEGFDGGIAANPYEGISDMRNVNIISTPKESAVNFKTQRIDQAPITTVAFTVLASNDTFTYNGAVPIKYGTAIVLNTLTGGTGLATSTTYWVNAFTATTFTVSASVAANGVSGSTVNVTVDGSGTFSTINMGLIVQITENQTDQSKYCIDTNGRVWCFNISSLSTNWVYLGNTPTSAGTPDFGSGITLWNGYIIALYHGGSGNGLYTCSAGLSTAVFTFFKSLSFSTTHRTLVDRSNQLYWCDGPNIGSLIQLTTFNPATPATYTYTAIALAVLASDTTQCIEQLNTNLLIGGLYNQVYSWDRSSTGYNLIFLPEKNTHRIIAVNSNAFMFCGNRGRIFVTNGANAQLWMKVPDHISGTVEPSFSWGGACFNKNQIYFGVTAFAPTGIATAIPNYGGIWAIDTDTKAMRIVNELSYGTYDGYVSEVFAATGSQFTTYEFPSSFGLICGWVDTVNGGSPTNGSDATSFLANPSIPNVPYSNYETYVDSDMIPVGTYLNPKTNANIEFKLTSPMVSGEGLKFSYRKNLTDSFTAITSPARPTGEFTSADDGSGIAGVIQANFEKSQWVQIRTFTKSTSSTPSYVRLREVRIR